MIQLINHLFQTNPIVAHAPGALYSGFESLCRTVWAQPDQPDKCDELTILTFNAGSRPEKPCGVFERSLKRFGIAPVVLGQEIKNWQNHMKLRLTAESLKTIRTPFVMAADSCDVLMLDS